MLFLVQSNIYSDPDHNRIFEVLEAQNISYEAIHLPHNAKSIDIHSNRNDVFVYGSVRLARLAKANTHWNPGSFYGGNHLFEVHSKYYKEHLLNYRTEIFKFGDIVEWAEQEQKFIKPYQHAKIFTGKVFTELKWTDFVQRSLANPPTALLNKDSLVQASLPQKIFKEARLWIVGQQVVAAVYYKFHGDVVFETEVAPEGIAFAKEMLAIFSVAEAFVMDICLTTEGWKIVEINCINSAGFYPNLNVASLVKALHIYFSD